MTWLQTRSGRAFDLLRPEPHMVDFEEDVAVVLGRIPRFTGHTEHRAYSVAQHCVIGADVLLRETGDAALAAAFLLHDAHEAYVGDIATPIVDALSIYLTVDDGRDVEVAVPIVKAQIAAMKARIDRAIHRAAGVPWPLPPQLRRAVKVMDLRLLRAERDWLLGPSPRPWGVDIDHAPPMHLSGFLAWSADGSADAWLQRLRQWCPDAFRFPQPEIAQ